MKIVVRIELITDWGEVSTIEVGRIDRPSQTLDPESVGLSLADGKQLLHNLQQAVIPAQAHEICALRRISRRCHRWTALKDYRQRKVDTVFGTVSFRSPRLCRAPVSRPGIWKQRSARYGRSYRSAQRRSCWRCRRDSRRKCPIDGWSRRCANFSRLLKRSIM